MIVTSVATRVDYDIRGTLPLVGLHRLPPERETARGVCEGCPGTATPGYTRNGAPQRLPTAAHSAQPSHGGLDQQTAKLRRRYSLNSMSECLKVVDTRRPACHPVGTGRAR